MKATLDEIRLKRKHKFPSSQPDELVILTKLESLPLFVSETFPEFLDLNRLFKNSPPAGSDEDMIGMVDGIAVVLDDDRFAKFGSKEDEAVLLLKHEIQ